MSLPVRLMGIAGKGQDGSILISDEQSMRNLPQYFLIGYNGATTQRPDGRGPNSAGAAAGVAFPQSMRIGTGYFDTTLTALCLWDGQNWRNPSTGALI
jgi:hypothetical protein